MKFPAMIHPAHALIGAALSADGNLVIRIQVSGRSDIEDVTMEPAVARVFWNSGLIPLSEAQVYAMPTPGLAEMIRQLLSLADTLRNADEVTAIITSDLWWMDQEYEYGSNLLVPKADTKEQE